LGVHLKATIKEEKEQREEIFRVAPNAAIQLSPMSQGEGGEAKKTGRVGEEPGQFGERRKWYMNFD
jgi:hypothetical protein